MPRKSSKKGSSQRQGSAKKERNESAAGNVSSKRAAIRGGRTGRSKLAKRAPRARVVAGEIGRATPIVDLGKIWGNIGILSPIEFRVSFIRPDDLLVCDFIFDNMRLTSEAPRKLVRRNPERFATLIVEFPPQSFGEEAFLEPTGPVTEKFDETSKKTSPPDKPGPLVPKAKNVETKNGDSVGNLPSARIRMAGRSRLAFMMPWDEPELDYTLDAVLGACRRWRMRLDSNAVAEPFLLLSELDELNADWLSSVAATANWGHVRATFD